LLSGYIYLGGRRWHQSAWNFFISISWIFNADSRQNVWQAEPARFFLRTGVAMFIFSGSWLETGSQLIGCSLSRDHIPDRTQLNWTGCRNSELVQTTATNKQKLSYRKQIARQLRTQYVDGIYDNPVTLKSRLRVTQGHWKQNHWVDHTRLTISRVIWRWMLSRPWNVGQRSLMA